MIVKKVSYIMISCGVALAASLLLLLISAFAVYKFNCSSGIIDLFVILIYVLSAFAGGFTGGKLIKERKFLWGLLIGTVYACIIIIVSLANHGGVSLFSVNGITSLLLCMAGGTLGGMLG